MGLGILGALPLVAALSVAATVAPAVDVATSERLFESWTSCRTFTGDPYALRSRDVRRQLERLAKEHPGTFTVLEEGASAEGRRIPLVSVGSGATKVLLWSQMHGDEPTASVALLDLLRWVGGGEDAAARDLLLSKLTLLIIPMLNPDGAERSQRRNAQGIDINRDALALVSPEGRFLRDVRDRYRPTAGYNLHNQNPLTAAGAEGPGAVLSVLSVPFDESFREDEGRRLTKRLALAVTEAVEPWAAGRVSRYDTGYTARAFGDSLTRWGTPTLLIESVGMPTQTEKTDLVRLNFVAILRSLLRLADGSLEELDPAAYDQLPLNREGRMFDLLISGGTVVGGNGLPPFRADVGILRPKGQVGDHLPLTHAIVRDLGDLDTFRGRSQVDAAGLYVLPAPSGDLRRALSVRKDGTFRWPGGDAGLVRLAKRLAKGPGPVRFGYPGELVLVERVAPDRYRLAFTVVDGLVEPGLAEPGLVKP